ncbi:maleylpyruvate isomerase N-terminal domain-containing protein [Kutzneria kofuensis]|uniref:Uncharacterized protein (TIGR03083 family) n=1 Tax=Kutzneria kofuensis TaxID=103725 RepID=A0A7W9KE22_9PSEU|nr:maleylpyruvate isomerase N-terminal domain-containing protein [Kutzneria kofuensis]MBB5890104.1 uncharacterized protein (TIGR03083 family) [Kutzneria kofuensis]
MSVTASDLDAATAALAAALEPVVNRDWTAATGTGDLNAFRTVEHLGDCLLSYAAQLVSCPRDRYVAFEAGLTPDATAADALEFAVTGGRLLAAAVRTASPDARAYHPTGMADPAGFAGMGVVEILVHGEDVARGLGVAVEPPADVCARVLERMFPEVTVAAEPWTALLWATDRVELPGLPNRAGWRWRGTPAGE